MLHEESAALTEVNGPAMVGPSQQVANAVSARQTEILQLVDALTILTNNSDNAVRLCTTVRQLAEIGALVARDSQKSYVATLDTDLRAIEKSQALRITLANDGLGPWGDIYRSAGEEGALQRVAVTLHAAVGACLRGGLVNFVLDSVKKDIDLLSKHYMREWEEEKKNLGPMALLGSSSELTEKQDLFVQKVSSLIRTALLPKLLNADEQALRETLRTFAGDTQFACLKTGVYRATCDAIAGPSPTVATVQLFSLAAAQQPRLGASGRSTPSEVGPSGASGGGGVGSSWMGMHLRHARQLTQLWWDSSLLYHEGDPRSRCRGAERPLQAAPSTPNAPSSERNDVELTSRTGGRAP